MKHAWFFAQIPESIPEKPKKIAYRQKKCYTNMAQLIRMWVISWKQYVEGSKNRQQNHPTITVKHNWTRHGTSESDWFGSRGTDVERLCKKLLQTWMSSLDNLFAYPTTIQDCKIIARDIKNIKTKLALRNVCHRWAFVSKTIRELADVLYFFLDNATIPASPFRAKCDLRHKSEPLSNVSKDTHRCWKTRIWTTVS